MGHVDVLLSDLPPFIYGTTSLGSNDLGFDERVAVARSAMERCRWFHVSHQYGDALRVLRCAFDDARERVPRMIFKVEWTATSEIADLVTSQLATVGVRHMDVAQLCVGRCPDDDLRVGSDCFDLLRDLKRDGRVGRYVVEVFPWTSARALSLLANGFAEQLVEGFIFYLNPLQRFASNPLWDELVASKFPVIAMRTFAGGHVHDLRDRPGAAWKPYLQERARAFAPLFDRAAVADWAEFCVRFAHGFPIVRATVGTTHRLDRLDGVCASPERIEPLPASLMAEAAALHRRWADEVDARAEPWSM